jgi:hypothetical protein
MTTSLKQNGKSATSKRYRIAGVTHDGVKILATGRATHFSDKEIRDSIRIVLRESRGGQLMGASGRKS